MDRYVTLSRKDPDFQAYLEGTFSRSHRALPVRSLNVNTQGERVTFEVVPLESITRPSWIVLWILAMRPHTAVFSLGPMLVVLAWLFAATPEHARSVSWPTASSFLGVLLFHISMNLFNDYYDHWRGQDRINPRGGSRAIQKGWLSARHVRLAAWLFMGTAVVCGLPVILSHFSVIAIIAILTLLAGLEFSSNRFGLKYRGFGETIAFLLTGPFLALGFAWAITGEFLLEAAILGLPFGLMTSMYYHLANFEDIMVGSQSEYWTLASRMGFEGAKKIFGALGMLCAATIALFAAVTGLWNLTAIVFLIHILFSLPLMVRVWRARSCLSSELRDIRRAGWALHLQTVLAFAALFLYEILRAAD